MKLSEALELENNRKKHFEVKFFNCGNFWRAYEFSAYLCCHLPYANDSNQKPLNAVRRVITNFDIIFAGLKFGSFKKYFPMIFDGDKYEMNENIITFDLSQYFSEDKYVEYKNSFEEWKESIKPQSEKESKKKSVAVSNDINQYDLIDNFINLQCDSITPLEAIKIMSDYQSLFRQTIQKR